MLLLNVLLALAWMALSGQFTFPDLVFGLVLGFVMLYPARNRLGGARYFEKVPLVLRFALYVVWELILANVNVAKAVLLTPKDQLKPGIVAIPLDLQTDAEITMLANLITLTPGTLSLDVSDDRKILYVHALDIGGDPEAFRQSTKQGFERAVQEVFN
jgi:multicomponent Na+:H+ antiporter subunit E